MSRPMKEMIVQEYQRRFDGVSNALLIDIEAFPPTTTTI